MNDSLDLPKADATPVLQARGAILEKAGGGSKATGEDLSNQGASTLSAWGRSMKPGGHGYRTGLPGQPCAAAFLCLMASNRQTPVATDTFRLLTLPAIGRRAR